MEYVYIPESVDFLGYEVFENCNNLKKVVFTNEICTIYHCDALEEIVYPADYSYALGIVAVNCKSLKKVTFPSCEKVNNVKISKDDYNRHVVNCPKVTIGYVNLEMVKSGKDNYAIVSPRLNKKVDKVASFKYTQKGTTGRLVWSEVDAAGYYQLYYKNNGKWERIYSGTDTSVTCNKSGEYKVRAVSYDGKTHVYGKFTKTTANYLGYIGRLHIKDNTLKWRKNENVTGYIVYYCTEKGGAYKKLTTTAENKVDISLLEDVYRFKVRAYYKSKSGTVYSQYSYKTI